MATQISNQATLNYNSGSSTLTSSSNTAVVTMQGPLEVTKNSLEQAYQLGDTITYNIFIKNTSQSTLTNLNVIDNLGTHVLFEDVNITPLSYIGPAKLFIDHVYSSTITGTVSPAKDFVTFTVDTLAPGSTILLQHKTTVNEYAGAIVGSSSIVNSVSVTATGVNAPVVATNTIPVASYAFVTLEKSMTPDPVVDGSPLTYTFHIYNYGTIEATNVALNDIFDPQPVLTLVTVDGVAVAPADYSYTDGAFLFPATGSTESYTIPAATYTQDPDTGAVTVVPGKSVVVIQGTI